MTTDAQFWDGIAERYARRPWPNPDATQRKLGILRRLMGPQDVVVDLGCGTGSIALELAPHAAHVHGVDISAEMVKIARDKVEAHKVRNVDFLQGTAEEGLASFAERSLAGISAFNILHLVDDWKGLLHRIFAQLRPGGYFVSSTPCLGNSLVPYRPILAVLRWLGKAPAVQFLRDDDLLQAMDDAGFIDITQPDVGAGKLNAFVVARRP